jgi:hypothetical protein
MTACIVLCSYWDFQAVSNSETCSNEQVSIRTDDKSLFSREILFGTKIQNVYSETHMLYFE